MVLTASTRPNSVGPAVARWFVESTDSEAGRLGAQLTSISLKDLDLPLLDEEEEPSTGIYAHPHTREWSRLVDSADGFIVVTPEYNFGMPASLKNALDYLNSEWSWKPMGFISYGNTSAGTRSVQHTKQVVTTLRLMPLGATIALRLGEAIIDGHVRQDPTTVAAAENLLGEAVRVSNALRPMREAGRTSSSPGPVPGSYIRDLTPADAEQVLVLQRSSWVDEALANSTLSLEPLHEDLSAVRTWLTNWTGAGVWLDGRLIAMARIRTEGTIGHIGRLAVVPDLRGIGIGSWLLQRAEAALQGTSAVVELSTGAKSSANIRLYESNGFRQVDDGHQRGTVTLRKTPAFPISTAV